MKNASTVSPQCRWENTKSNAATSMHWKRLRNPKSRITGKRNNPTEPSLCKR